MFVFRGSTTLAVLPTNIIYVKMCCGTQMKISANWKKNISNYSKLCVKEI